MNKFTGLIKKVGKWTAITASVLFSLGMILSYAPAKDAKSADLITPRFNFLQGDYEMLSGKLTSSTNWVDPVSANIGDKVNVLFYYHNGMINSVAHNTKVRVDLPITNSDSLKLTSYLWSDQTPAISDTTLNDAIVGNSGLTINLPSSGRVEYIPGSTYWYPDQATDPRPVPDGIVSGTGLNIGDIQGCWQYSGYVAFTVEIKGQADLVMNKQVAHPGDATWSEEIFANEGDTVAYKVAVRNDGNDIAKNITVKDQLPQHMTYIAGTTYLYDVAGNATKEPDTMFTTGLSLADILSGADHAVFLTYKTKIDTNIPSQTGGWYLNNVARVYINGTEVAQDQAKVSVTCIIKTLDLNKKVWSGSAWVEENSAHIGDTVNYQIIVTNTGNTAIDNVYVRDVMPVSINYIPGSTKLNNAIINDQIVSTNGYLIGSLNAGQTVTITLSGKVFGCLSIGGPVLLNTSYVHADGIAEMRDSAQTLGIIDYPIAPRI